MKGKEVVILGVCNANVSGATLFIGGDVIASVSEERFTRIKNDDAFPWYSIEYCLEEGSITPQHVDFICCGSWGGLDVEGFLPVVVEEIEEMVIRDKNAIPLINQRTVSAIRNDARKKQEMNVMMKEMGFKRQHVYFYDHHLSHAYTAFYTSPFEQALVVTIDGRGDFKSATVSEFSREKGIRLLDSVSMYSSPGILYGFITKYLGFTPDKHEGKVTGLAAFGNPHSCIHILRKMMTLKKRHFFANMGKYYTPFMRGALPQLERELLRYKKEDIAAAVQYLLEDLVIRYIKPFLAKTKLRYVCLAGGVFGNVKLNQRILELPGVNNIFVFPHMGDGGNAFGGALIKLYQLGGKLNSPLRHVYLGPSWNNSEIRRILERLNNKVIFFSLKDFTIRKVAQDLVEGKIVGFFKGRMEYGPRALGARTILSRATDSSITAKLNKRLNRTEFMPFAPVTMERFTQKYYKGWRKDHIASRFMTVCYSCFNLAIQQTPGIVHVDNTARPQVLSRDENPLYYDILNEYYKITNIPTLINTSFNNHEEPIVCSPEDAIKSLLIGNVDYIVMEDYVVFSRKDKEMIPKL